MIRIVDNPDSTTIVAEIDFHQESGALKALHASNQRYGTSTLFFFVVKSSFSAAIRQSAPFLNLTPEPAGPSLLPRRVILGRNEENLSRGSNTSTTSLAAPSSTFNNTLLSRQKFLDVNSTPLPTRLPVLTHVQNPVQTTKPPVHPSITIQPNAYGISLYLTPTIAVAERHYHAPTTSSKACIEIMRNPLLSGPHEFPVVTTVPPSYQSGSIAQSLHSDLLTISSLRSTMCPQPQLHSSIIVR